MAKDASSRRRFVKELALGSAAVALGSAAARPEEAAAVLVDRPSQAPRPAPRPADTGERVKTHRVAYASGVPLGGIGTGSVEVRPDGYFHEWMIFNLGPWASDDGRSGAVAANDHATSNVPNVWYASVYPISMIAKIILAQLLVGRLL